jgi:hypothetical protein
MINLERCGEYLESAQRLISEVLERKESGRLLLAKKALESLKQEILRPYEIEKPQDSRETCSLCFDGERMVGREYDTSDGRDDYFISVYWYDECPKCGRTIKNKVREL